MASIVPAFDKGDEPDYVELPDEQPHTQEQRKVIVRSEAGSQRYYKVVVYLKNNVWKILYYKGSKLHRDEKLGAAFTMYDQSDPSKIRAEVFFRDGKRHRTLKAGPADSRYVRTRKGNEQRQDKYYLDDELISEEY